MTERLAIIVVLLAFALGYPAFAQSGLVPPGSIVVECEDPCRVEMPVFGLVESVERGEVVSIGGLQAGVYVVRIGTEEGLSEVEALVCGSMTEVHVSRADLNVEQPSCEAVGFLAISLPDGARAEVAGRSFRSTTTVPLYAGSYEVVFYDSTGASSATVASILAGKTEEIALAPAPASVMFVGAPAGTMAEFSGVGAFEGVGPHLLDPGLYVVRLVAPGYEELSLTLRVEEGAQIERPVEMRALPLGSIRIDVIPSSAVIQIAGEVFATGEIISLPVGTYVASITAPDHVEERREIEVVAEQESSWTVELNPEPGHMLAHVRPSSAEMRINGVLHASGEEIALAPGTYDVEVTAPGFESSLRTLEIGPNEEIEIDVALRPRTRFAISGALGPPSRYGELIGLLPQVVRDRATIAPYGQLAYASDGELFWTPPSWAENVPGRPLGGRDLLLASLSEDGTRSGRAVRFGTRQNDFAVDLVARKDGSLVVLHRRTRGNQASPVYEISAFDASLTRLWTRQVARSTNNGDIRMDALAVGPEGQLYAAGTLLGETPLDSDLVVALIDREGDVRWVKTYDFRGDDVANDIEVDASGSIWLVGTTDAGRRSGVGILVKLDMTGDLVAVVDYEDFGNVDQRAETSEFVGVAVGAAGRVFVAGRVNLVSAAVGVDDVVVAAFSQDAEPLWTSTFGTSGGDSAATIATDALGRILVAGLTRGLLGTESYGGDDAFLAAIGSDGDLLWVEQFGTPADEQAWELVTYPEPAP